MKTLQNNLAVIESLKDPVIVSNLDLKIIFVNSAAQQFFGVPPEVLAGDNREIDDWIETLKAGRVVDDQETAIADKQNVLTDVSLRLSALRDSAGVMTGVIQVIRDITEEKKASQELLRYAAKLSAANRELEQFAYTASHDLQQEVRNISNFAGLLREHFKNQYDEAIDFYITVIEASSAKMSLLMNELLQYSRIGRTKVVEQVDCAEVVAGVLDKLVQKKNDCGARVHIGDLPVIQGDPKDMALVFHHLLNNALTFTRPGTAPVIEITCGKKQGAFMFCVKDNGIGIKEEFWEKIFIVFTRLHADGDYPGIGMGLTFCKKIIGLYGGDIWVKSDPTFGSGFCFTIPEPLNSTA